MATFRSIAFVGLLMALAVAAHADEAHHQGGAATVRSGQLLGQPWEEKSGQWRGRVFGSYLSSGSIFDGEGTKKPLGDDGRFTNLGVNLFGEYVITDRWSVSAFLPLQRSTLENNLTRESWTSRGDMQGWARYRFDDLQGFSPAIVMGAKLPGNYRVVSGFGDGQVDYELQGFLTKNLDHGHYYSFNSGYRVRVGSISDEFLFGGQIGFSAKPGWMLITSVNGVKGIGSGIQKDYLNAGFTALKTISGPWSLIASYNKIIYGKNSVDAEVWSVGISFK